MKIKGGRLRKKISRNDRKKKYVREGKQKQKETTQKHKKRRKENRRRGK